MMSNKSGLTAAEQLQEILDTTPPDQVIARIEELNPDWKHDLLPWKVAAPGETIPWQAVYCLIEQPTPDAAVDWAQRKLKELGLVI